MNNKKNGDMGEQEVVDSVPCPNCGKKLMLLPKSFPMYDVQCTACIFRAQVKTNSCKPKSTIFGAGWTIMEKVLKAGNLIPPLFTVFHWKDEQYEIRFYPFIPKKAAKPYILSDKAKRAGYKMFRYTNLDEIPYFIVAGTRLEHRRVNKTLGMIDVLQYDQQLLP